MNMSSPMRSFASLGSCNSRAGTRVTPQIVRGGLELHLTQHVRQHDVDLVVMGAQGRDALTGALLGSTAAKLLDCLPCDSMVVPRPRSAG